MWSVLVVPAEVAGEGAGAVGAGGVGEAVGPFAQERLDERFGFPVGLGPWWSGVAAADLELSADGRPGLGAVAVAVVGEDGLDGDVALGVPGDGAPKEGGASRGPSLGSSSA